MKKVVLYSRDKSWQKKGRICKKKHREHPAIAHDHLVKLKAKDLILPRNEERVVLELPLWNRKHRFLQKNNVATVSEEAPVKMKNTHSTQGERNRKKQKKREWDTDFFSFSSLPPVKFLQEATLHALSIAPNNFVMMYAKYNPTWAAYLAMETTRQALYCQNFSSSISWQISYFLLRIFTQDWAIGPHTLLH